MELRKTADGQSFIIDVEKKKGSVFGTAARILSILAGIGGFVISVVLFVTLIGIIIAIPLFIVSAFLIAAGLGYQRVECPNCNRKQGVRKGAGQFECKSCKKLTLIEWK
ncbi:transposase [Bacillus cereus]|nr:transposase [Bacillus cereus]